uniref:Uncharacterized protein n=1 Tax=Glossina austeni TaxID=7395 RepID=A0A1A9UTJ2_GLOAU
METDTETRAQKGIKVDLQRKNGDQGRTIQSKKRSRHNQIGGDHRAEKDTLLRGNFLHFYYSNQYSGAIQQSSFLFAYSKYQWLRSSFWLLVVYTCLFIIVMGFHSWQTTRECGLSGNLHTHSQLQAQHQGLIEGMNCKRNSYLNACGKR